VLHAEAIDGVCVAGLLSVRSLARTARVAKPACGQFNPSADALSCMRLIMDVARLAACAAIRRAACHPVCRVGNILNAHRRAA
jgi:hypothetical protein